MIVNLVGRTFFPLTLPFDSQILEPIFGKFKEKKATVVMALHEALDAVAPTISLEKAIEPAVASLKSKNPDEKQQTAAVRGVKK